MLRLFGAVITAVFLLSAFFPCRAAAASYKSIFAFGQRYVSLSDYARSHAMTLSRKTGRTDLVNGKSRIVFFDRKKDAYFNGVKVMLSYPPYVKGGIVYLSSIDVITVVDVLLRTYSVPRHNPGVIILDPGHGGKDNGCQANGIREDTVTLKTALKCAAMLRKRGFKVYLTRTGDRAVSLNERVAFAKRNKGQIFVSIHVNAAADRSIDGIETFCLTPAGAASSNGGKSQSSSYSGNRFDRNNLFLAMQLHRNILYRSGGKDRGIKRARFVVIRDAVCPAVLLEMGFASNRSEARKLASDAYLDKIAVGIADGISSYFRQLKK